MLKKPSQETAFMMPKRQNNTSICSQLQVGMWIGVALGLLVVLGLLVLGVYFYMKQRALQSTKPPPYSRDRDGTH